jgi:hypothetical protein
MVATCISFYHQQPGIVLPQIDQDIDPTGDEILRFRKIMGVFTQLPFEDKTLYFDSKAEYLAFFRWELVSAFLLLLLSLMMNVHPFSQQQLVGENNSRCFLFPTMAVGGPKGKPIV